MTYAELFPILELLRPLLSQYLAQQGGLGGGVAPNMVNMPQQMRLMQGTTPPINPMQPNTRQFNPMAPISTLPRMQRGGIATRPTLVGESGQPELVLPLSGLSTFLGGGLAPQLLGGRSSAGFNATPLGSIMGTGTTNPRATTTGFRATQPGPIRGTGTVSPRMPIYPGLQNVRQSIFINPLLRYLSTAGSW